MGYFARKCPLLGIFSIYFIASTHCIPENYISTKDKSRNLVGEEEGDYIISQKTWACLTAFGGSIEGYSVSLAECDGRKGQQWIIQEPDILLAADLSFYLVPDNEGNDVIVKKLEKRTHEWEKDENGRFAVSSTDYKMFLEVPHVKKDISNVSLGSRNRKREQRWWTKSELDTFLDETPLIFYPFPSDNVDMFKQEMARSLNNRLTPLTEPLPYARDIANFPGVVPNDVPRVNGTVFLDLSIIGQTRDLRMRVPENWQATRFYAAAGDIVEIILPTTLSVQQASQISVRTGPFTDRLNEESTNVVKRKEFRRIPILTETFTLTPGENKIRSQYGGNIIFMFTDGENFQTTVQIRNAVEAVYFKLGETTPEEWTLQKGYFVPVALFESEKTVIVATRNDAIKTDDPTEVLKRYDEVVSLLNEAAGFDEQDPPPRGKYWLLADVQLKGGGSHAGFPIMFHLPKNLIDIDFPYQWVVWHEFGHNYQQQDYWDRSYGAEVTVNLFSSYIQQQLFCTDRLETNGIYERAARKVNDGSTYKKLTNWEQLIFLMEINNYFPDHKWEMFTKLRKAIRNSPEEEVRFGEKIDKISWSYENLSKIVGYDLINTYNRWGIKLTNKAKENTAHLEKAPADLSKEKNELNCNAISSMNEE